MEDPMGSSDSGSDEAFKRELIAGYNADRDDLDKAVATLPPKTPCGPWTVIEIVAHVAAWEQWYAELMVSAAHGVPEPVVDVDKMNAAIAADARSSSPDQTLAMYQAGREIFVASLEELPAAAFRMGPVQANVKTLRDHCVEHAAELRALAG
jgi:uncharacterized protein (TIGR03083 family)